MYVSMKLSSDCSTDVRAALVACDCAASTTTNDPAVRAAAVRAEVARKLRRVMGIVIECSVDGGILHSFPLPGGEA